MPFQKGDSSDELEGQAIGAAWWRDNPIVIDWSREAVRLLRKRSEEGGARTPYFRNEHLWFAPGVGYNAVGRYLRARIVPAGAIFGHGAPLLRPTVHWLDEYALCALLCSDVVEAVLRTFLSSLMNLHVGDIRRLPVPVLTPDQSRRLSQLGEEAVTKKSAGEGRPLKTVEADVHAFARELYRISPNADLWVVR